LQAVQSYLLRVCNNCISGVERLSRFSVLCACNGTCCAHPAHELLWTR